MIERALAEDVGDGDVTTAATVDATARGRATITQKAPGVISGFEAAEAVFRQLDPDVRIERLVDEGVCQLPSDTDVNGPASTVVPSTRVSVGGLCSGRTELPLASPFRIIVVGSELVLSKLSTALIPP